MRHEQVGPHDRVGLTAGERALLARIETGLRAGETAVDPLDIMCAGPRRVGARQVGAWTSTALGGLACGLAGATGGWPVLVVGGLLLVLGAVLLVPAAVLRASLAVLRTPLAVLQVPLARLGIDPTRRRLGGRRHAHLRPLRGLVGRVGRDMRCVVGMPRPDERR